MKTRLVVVVASVALLGADMKQEEASAKENPLQGVWRFVSVEVDGKTAPAGAVEGMRMAFVGDEYVCAATGPVAGRIVVDTSTKPASVDFVPDAGPDMGKALRSIYRIEGDLLTICGALSPDGDRPTDFTTKAGDGRSFVILKRAKR